MTLLKLKKLWSITGKQKTVINSIYGTTGNPLNPDLSDDNNPPCCLFETVNRVGGKKMFLFDNESQNGAQLWEAIADRIQTYCQRHVFYLNSPHREIAAIVFSVYHDITLEDAMASNVRLIDKDPCWNLNGVLVYNLRKKNLVSDIVRSPIFSNAIITIRNCDMSVICKGVAFWTEYDQDLYFALQKIHYWKLNRGRAADQKREEFALVATLEDGRKQKDVAFAEIVWQFHHGMIDMADFVKSVITNHAKLSASKVVIDHLTQRRTNNFFWALAAIPNGLNRDKNLSSRDRIAKPWFFVTVFDESAQKFKVRLGNFKTGWERRYLFDDLAVLNSNGVYVYDELLSKFKTAIGPQFVDDSRDSHLRYWSDPDLAHDPDNILTDTLRTPLETYTDALQLFDSDNWDDIFRQTELLNIT